MAHLAINFPPTFVVGLAECTNRELRTAWEMYMKLFQTPLLLKNVESIDNKRILNFLYSRRWEANSKRYQVKRKMFCIVYFISEKKHVQSSAGIAITYHLPMIHITFPSSSQRISYRFLLGILSKSAPRCLHLM